MLPRLLRKVKWAQDYDRSDEVYVSHRPHAYENPLPQKTPAGSHTDAGNPVLLDVASGTTEDKIVIVMVGLPARGKTHIARMLGRYVSFFHGVPVKHVNVGMYRRDRCGNFNPSHFFDSANEDAEKLRHACRKEACDDIRDFMQKANSGQIAVMDATNATKARRKWICDQFVDLRIKIIFVESICTDNEVIERNIRSVKISTPDYANMDPDEAIQDFRARIREYEKVYETLDFAKDESHLSGIQLIDGHQVVINRVRGFLPGRIVQFLGCMHTSQHTIYLTRHGRSEYNVLGKIGGDSGLSKDGVEYSRKLAQFVKDEVCRDKETRKVVPGRLWTSTLRRTIDTGKFIKTSKIVLSCKDFHAWSGDAAQGRTQEWVQMRPKRWQALDEIYAGVCDGMTYKEIEKKYPEEFARRSKDKLAYRYPRGESYLDVIHRLDQMVLEMERHREPLLLIGHQGILRLIYAFYMGQPRERAPHVSIPLNTVIKLTPMPYGCEEQRIVLHKSSLKPNSDGQDEPHPKEQMKTSIDDPPSH